MKRTTLRIVEKFPHFKEIIALNENEMLNQEHFRPLPLVDQTFLRLAYFFENPEKENFNLTLLYKGLDNDWLEWADCHH